MRKLIIISTILISSIGVSAQDWACIMRTINVNSDTTISFPIESMCRVFYVEIKDDGIVRELKWGKMFESTDLKLPEITNTVGIIRLQFKIVENKARLVGILNP